MNIIRQQVRFITAYSSFLLVDEIPCFVRNFLQLTKMLKVDRSSLDVSVLEKRLAEAERRIHLLFREVGDIRTKLTLAKQLNGASASAVDASEASTSGKNKTVLINYDDSPPAKRTKHGFNVEDDYVVVYCDGACENNGKTNAKAGIGVWFGDDNPLNVAQPVNGRATNNTAEIQACVAAVKVVKENDYKKVKIFTDSEFVIKCMTQWIHKWKQNNWRVASGGEVKNKEDLVKLDALMRTMEDVKFKYVKGHAGIKGNEEADKLARAGALRYVK